MLIEATQFCVTVGSNRGIYEKKPEKLFKKNTIYFFPPLFHRPWCEKIWFHNSWFPYLVLMAIPQIDRHLLSGQNVYALMQQLVVCLCLLAALTVVRL